MRQRNRRQEWLIKCGSLQAVVEAPSPDEAFIMAVTEHTPGTLGLSYLAWPLYDEPMRGNTIAMLHKAGMFREYEPPDAA